LKLVQLKENAEDAATGRKIRDLLFPMEYIRLDQTIDVMFTTATDVDSAIIAGAPATQEKLAVGAEEKGTGQEIISTK